MFERFEQVEQVCAFRDAVELSDPELLLGAQELAVFAAEEHEKLVW